MEAGLQALLEQHAQRKLPDGRQAVVRNGFLPERTIQTGIGDVEIKVPKVRDRSGSGVCFNSSLLSPYLKLSNSIEELLPWLSCEGIYSNVRMGDRLCLLVIIGVTEHGNKELVAVEDGLRESESSWTELLMGLRARGLDKGPKLAVGDGALGFLASAGQVLPGHSPSTVLGAQDRERAGSVAQISASQGQGCAALGDHAGDGLQAA